MSTPPDADWRPLPVDWSGAPETDLHLVRVPLSQDGTIAPEAVPELSQDEVQRAQRYVVERPRRQFVTTRRALRCLCGRWLGLPPRAVTFEFATWGKPQLAARQNPEGLAFNVSHSGDWGVIALGWRRTLGVDLETADPRLDHTGLARRFFSDDEQRQLAALPADLRTAGFYHVWTGKEAYLKATGLGMSFPLGSFTVAADPRLPPRLLAVADRPEEPRRWTAAAFTPADNVFGTVMWDGGPAEIHRWTWLDDAGC